MSAVGAPVDEPAQPPRFTSLAPSRRLRLHVLIDSLGQGGAEALLADFAIAVRAGGIELSVAYLHARTTAAGRLSELGIEPTQVPIRSLLGYRDRHAVRRHLAAVRPDLLHTHLGYSDLLGSLGARALGIPSVSTLHIEDWDRRPRERVKHHLMAMARRRGAARVIAVSEAARRSYLARRWDRPERIVAVHNGILDRSSPGSGPEIRRQLGLAPDELVLAMVGVLRPEKRHDIAIEAVERLAQRFERVRLLIVGDGPERAQVERLARRAGRRVSLAGYRADVPALLDAVDVLVHPSRTDAFPSALLEAMAARVPAVATAVGGIPEIIEDGETGIMIPAPPGADMLASAVGRLLADRGLRLRIGANGRKDYEARFTTGRWLERLAPVYEYALKQADDTRDHGLGALQLSQRTTR